MRMIFKSKNIVEDEVDLQSNKKDEKTAEKPIDDLKN